MKRSLAVAPTAIAAVFVAVLAACAQGPGGPPASTAGQIQVPAIGARTSQSLYVGNDQGGVTVYDANSGSPVRTITDGIAHPATLGFDSHGKFYVANALSGNGVTVYARDSATLLHELHPKDAATSLVFDVRGNLYVSLGNGKVAVYAPGDTTPALEIGEHSRPLAQVALDSKGNVYTMQMSLGVPVSSEIRMYGPSGSAPRVYTFTSEDEPVSMAVDSQDNLYVGIKSTKANTYGRVDVFGAGGTSLIRRYIDLGVPAALLFDRSGKLYVADSKHNDIYIYHAGRPTRLRRLTDAVDGPVALALDASENVYVANAKSSTVTVYEAGGNNLIRTISDGIKKPASLAFGP